MISENNKITVPYILSDAAQKAYIKIKEMILKIFSLLKHETVERDLKEQFREYYIDFAKRLDEDNRHEESNIYMSICEMYYHLIDRPKELVAHEDFFKDLFEAFDELLQYKLDNIGYDEKRNNFFEYYGHMRHYYYTNVALPSKYYDEDVLNQISDYLSRGGI